MRKILVIAEKPDACRRLAKALSDIVERRVERGVEYWIGRQGINYLIFVSALGHLYTLTTREKGYPIWSFEWRPKIEAESAKLSKKFLDYMRKLMLSIKVLDRDIDEYVVATDYDIEGSTIAYTILHYLLGGKEHKASRMKFSTLIEDELVEAYKNRSSLDWENIRAGIARHGVDFLYGINISRALMNALRTANKNRVLSAGRVQTVILKWIVDREREIRTFVPLPYWSLSANVLVDRLLIKAESKMGAITHISEAERIAALCSGKYGVVKEVRRTTTRKNPPPPFCLGALQADAYKYLRLTPDKTLEIAEKLYLKALISYPRTSSEKLPEMNYRELLRKIARIPEFSELANSLLREGRTSPVKGKGADRAHPAIYATGEIPGDPLSKEEKAVYEMIVRRTLACFAKPLVYDKITAEILCEGYYWQVKGLQLKDKGYLLYYNYEKLKETFIPPLRKNQRVFFKSVDILEKFTNPPNRYNPRSLLKNMEKENIGTSATRAEIMKTIESRGYVKRESFYIPTELGFAVIETLERFCPELTSVEMTRRLEEDLDGIIEGKLTETDVLNKTREQLAPILVKMKANELSIGLTLSRRPKGTRCIICWRPAENDNLCSPHKLARENLLKALETWLDRYDGTLTADKIVQRIKNLKLTGEWILDVINRGLYGKTERNSS